MCQAHEVMCLVMCLTPLCLHQGIAAKVFALEKKLADLKAENQPISAVLRQLIHTLCAEEVRYVWITQPCIILSFFLNKVCFVYGFGPKVCFFLCVCVFVIRTFSAPSR